jgi:hypothetical protein
MSKRKSKATTKASKAITRASATKAAFGARPGLRYSTAGHANCCNR